MLNKEQLEASEIKDDRVLVLAGPGTGKTTTLVSRYMHLINEGIKPEEIICCTFSRKAVDEIKYRISKELNLDVKNLPVDTFHSLAIKALNKLANTININNPKTILKPEERRNIITNIKNENPKILEDLKFSDQMPSNVLQYIDLIREQLTDPEDAAIEASEKGDTITIAYADMYKLYEDYLTQNSLVDFPRMIHYGYKAFAQDAANNKTYISQFKHILIDEYQDINFAQKSMVDELLKGGSSLWVVGDDDQAIYGWRGSNVKFILEFEYNYEDAKKVILNTNYRSENKIVIAANNLAKRFVERHPKNIISFGTDEGEVSVFKNKDEDQEAFKILDLINNRSKDTQFKDVAILARTNTLPKSVVKALSNADIPMVLKNNVNIFNDSSTKDLLTAVAISCGVKPQRGWDKKISPKLDSFSKKLLDENNWQKKIKSLSTFIKNQFSSKLKENEKKAKEKELDNCLSYLSQYENASKAFQVIGTLFKQPKDGNGVHIGTIHGAKGLEWETVIVMGCEDDKLPHSLNSDVWEIEEERRVAYVGITRPKTNLFLTWSENRDGLGKLPSPYLNEILDEKADEKKIIKEDKVSRYASIMENWGEEAREHQKKIEKLKLIQIHREKKRREEFIAEKQRRAETIAENRRAINSSIADGMGQGSGWIKDTGDGFFVSGRIYGKKGRSLRWRSTRCII
ncbi:ATP-dependent helicase, partial [Alphaproteobacteria bacterium]|nr:ATP-dependent helicase [Alphaproteobacteria bacterium]